MDGSVQARRLEAEAAALAEVLQRPTVSIRTAGLVLGVGINKAYDAAKAGQIPTIDLGGKRVVPCLPLRRLLGLSEERSDA